MDYLTDAEIDEFVDEIDGPVYDPRVDDLLAYFAAEEQAGIEQAWAERLEEIRQLAEQYPELRDPETLAAVTAEADALAQEAGLDDLDAAFFVSDPAVVTSALATVSSGTDPAEAYGQAAWNEIREAGAEAFDPEQQRRAEVEGLQRQVESLREEAHKARRDQRKGPGVADAMEERASRLEAQAQERATTTDSSLPYEDEAPPEVIGGVEDASYPEIEPTREERITEGIELGGGDPNDYGDRTWAEIDAVDSGDPWR
jgi:hypothetical protein